MLKNILLILALTILGATTAHSQGLVVMPADTVYLDTTSTTSQESIAIASVKNNSAGDSIFKWRIVYNTFPHCYTMGFCDPTECIAPLPGGTITFKFLPGVTAPFQFDVTPSCGSYCGNIKVLVWAVGDSANTSAALNYKACLTTTPNGISEVEPAQIAIYPNPVRNQLNISLPSNLENGKVEIFNLIGSKVYSQAISNSSELDMSALENGLYVVRISDAGKVIATKKFTKQD